VAKRVRGGSDTAFESLGRPSSGELLRSSRSEIVSAACAVDPVLLAMGTVLRGEMRPKERTSFFRTRNLVLRRRQESKPNEMNMLREKGYELYRNDRAFLTTIAT
jgi:hypothetical protein